MKKHKILGAMAISIFSLILLFGTISMAYFPGEESPAQTDENQNDAYHNIVDDSGVLFGDCLVGAAVDLSSYYSNAYTPLEDVTKAPGPGAKPVPTPAADPLKNRNQSERKSQLDQEMSPYMAGGPVYVVSEVRSLNIREDASEESDVVGKLFSRAVGIKIESRDGWTRILSGSINGWVCDDYILIGDEAEKQIDEWNSGIAVVDVANLRIREQTDVTSDVVAVASQGTELIVEEELDGWYRVYYTGTVSGYVSSEFVEYKEQNGDAISLENEELRIEKVQDQIEIREEAERERIAAEKAREEEERQKYNASSGNSGSSDNSGGSGSSGNSAAPEAPKSAPVSASYDDTYLLATLLDTEATGYEAQLAVASVVVNRLHSGIWGSSISSVIYSPGQFWAAGNGILDSNLSNGPSSTAMQAATDALNGSNNIGGYLFFMSARSAGDCSQFSSYLNVGGNVFYER